MRVMKWCKKVSCLVKSLVKDWSATDLKSKMNTFHNQEHLYGLQVDKEFQLNGFEYEISLGYLHGLTDVSANHALLWNFEYEFN